MAKTMAEKIKSLKLGLRRLAAEAEAAGLPETAKVLDQAVTSLSQVPGDRDTAIEWEPSAAAAVEPGHESRIIELLAGKGTEGMSGPAIVEALGMTSSKDRKAAFALLTDLGARKVIRHNGEKTTKARWQLEVSGTVQDQS